MDTPLVSIIIPVYNGSDFLDQAIESALAQTYENIEILVVNDGSDDGGSTERIALSYGNKIKYFTKENGGVSSALNTGIRNMRGEYFSWLSHDDIYLPEKIEAQIGFIRSNPAAKVVGTDFYLLEQDTGNEILMAQKGPRVIATGRQLLGTWVFLCSMIIHRSCFEAVGLFDEENKTTQDTEMQLRLVQHTPFYVIDKALVKHRRHSEQTSTKYREKHRKDQNELMKTILERFELSMFASKEILDKSERFKTYIWLGDYALRKGAFGGAEFCYKKALRVKPFSPRLAFQLLIGLKNWQKLTEK